MPLYCIVISELGKLEPWVPSSRYRDYGGTLFRATSTSKNLTDNLGEQHTRLGHQASTEND